MEDLYADNLATAVSDEGKYSICADCNELITDCSLQSVAITVSAPIAN